MKSEVCLKYFDHDCNNVIANKFKGFFCRFLTLTSIFLLTNKKERGRGRARARARDTHTHTHTHTQRHTHRERHTQRETHTHRERHTQRETHTQRHRERDKRETRDKRERDKRGSVCTVSTRSWVRIPLGPTFYVESKNLSSK